MSKHLRRWRRVFVRLASPFFMLQKTWKRVMAALVTLGIAATAFRYWSAVVKPWLTEDWSHVTVVVLALAFLCALLAMYGTEKERDEAEATGVQVVDVFPINSIPTPGVYRLDVLAELRNNSAHQRSLKIDVVRLEEKWLIWRQAQREFEDFPPWFGEVPVVLEPFSSTIESLGYVDRITQVLSDFAGSRLRLKIRIAIPGQPSVERTISLPILPVEQPSRPE